MPSVSGSIMSMFEQYGQNIVRGSRTHAVPVQIQDARRYFSASVASSRDRKALDLTASPLLIYRD
jgi:hypothetical protein